VARPARPASAAAFALAAAFAFALGCGSGAPAGGGPPGSPGATQRHPCGVADKVHQHELDAHEEGATHAYVPCSGKGGHDYSAVVKVESTPEGVHVHIDATDEDVNEGVFGSDLVSRDAVVVYPRGRGERGVEVPLKRTPHGYTGEKVVSYEELHRLHDEGTKLEVTVYDHDDDHGHGHTHEQLTVSVAVSTGKSCERAADENPQTLDLTKKGGGRDLTADELGGPMRTARFFAHCALKDSESAEICAAVKGGRPLGVSVAVSPSNKRAAACIDRAARKLRFPSSDRLDVVKQKFLTRSRVAAARVLRRPGRLTPRPRGACLFGRPARRARCRGGPPERYPMKNRHEIAWVLALGLSAFGAGCAVEGAPPAGEGGAVGEAAAALDVGGFGFSAELQQAIDDARDACGCFGDVKAVEVPAYTPAGEVFYSDDVLYALLDLDVQLPWAAAGEINALALSNLLGAQSSLINAIAAEADPSGGGFRLGAHSWSHMTAPDYCSGEKLYLMYFRRTGVVFSFRFDSSSEC
jgi:hypothetical protein